MFWGSLFKIEIESPDILYSITNKKGHIMATGTTLPKLTAYKMYPTEMKLDKILYSEQRSMKTTFIEVDGEFIDVSTLDLESSPRFTITPSGKSDDDIKTHWMNDYSGLIDLNLKQWSCIFVVHDDEQSIPIQGFDSEGNARTMQEAKALVYKQLGYEIK